MSEDNKIHTLATVENTLKIIDGVEQIEFPVPLGFEGYTFIIDHFTSHDEEKAYNKGKFRIEYTLSTEFIIYYPDLKGINISSGFSNVEIDDPAIEICLTYNNKRDKSRSENVKITPKVDPHGVLQGLVVITPNLDLNDAIQIADTCIADILDSICFNKQKPFIVRNIEVYHIESGRLVRRYVTAPYYNVKIQGNDFLVCKNFPPELRPCLRLFREAVNSTSPCYRLLCLYRIREHIKIIHEKFIDILKERGDTEFKVDDVRVPDNSMIRAMFPDKIGRKIKEFLDFVYDEYRIPIAHVGHSGKQITLEDYESLLLDPTRLKINQEIDAVNSVLIATIPQMVDNEKKFMERKGFT